MHDASLSRSWTNYALFFVGLWLIFMASTFNHKSDAIVVSDIISGVVVIFFALFTGLRATYWTRWALALVGVWLQFAPLCFWAPMGISYLNDTLIGVLVIALAVLLPPDPIENSVKGGEIPPGWSYNPSSWMQRIPVIFLAFCAWMFARYMAAYQLGYVDTVWDPVFGDGTMDVITSKVSKQFPVPDAGLGAMCYTIETLLGAHGSSRRWHTLPWFVTLFALLVIPVGFTSIVLITLQPILVGDWCFWCLLTAVCMLFMIALAVDEVVASLSFLSRARERGDPFSKTFSRGGDDLEAKEDTRKDTHSIRSFSFGMSLPWNLVISTLIGFFLMFSPKFFLEKGYLADFDHIIGALIMTFSIISMAEVIRSFRYVNILLGSAALIMAFFSSEIEMWNHIIIGVVVILLAIPKGNIKESYGSWDKRIF
ncbi:vitamin K epoxide reductase family protein [Chlamydiales bacterium]|nr:vitamin K epoxide reductase family protein [Chlamydiales bacterium]